MVLFYRFQINLRKKIICVVESEDGKALAIYIHHPEKPGMIKPLKVLRICRVRNAV